MALQVWLPLISNTNNNGVSGISGSLTNASISYQDGKLGKALRIANYATTTATFDGIANKTVWSITVWLKLSSSDATPSYQDFFVVGCDNNGATGGGFRIEHKNVAGRFQIVTPKLTTYGDSNSWYTFVSNDTVCNNLWAHIVIVNNGTQYVTYINGALYSTVPVSNFSAGTSKLTGTVTLGQAGAYCWLNDLRIYDHALSLKEVREISKGLVCHHPLESQYEVGQINKYSGDYTDGYFAGGSFTRTKLSDERGYKYTYSYTGTGSNVWVSLSMPTFAFTAGKTYFYSMKVRCNKWTAGNFALRAARSSNDYGTNGKSVEICSSAKADGKWHEYYVSQVINSTYERGGSTVTCNPLLESYSSNLNGNGTVYQFDFDIKDVQVVESDVYVPYIKNEYAGTTAIDTSGFGRHMSTSGTLIYSNDSPKYLGSRLFNQGGYLTASFGLVTTAFTLNFWVKPKAMNNQHFIFGTFDNWTNNGIGMWRDTASPTKYSCLIKSSAESNYSNQGMTDVTNDVWHMITLVYTGTKYIGYLDKTKKFDVTYGSNGTISNPVYMIGNSKYNGTPVTENEQAYISDVRFYATALSDADIIELYNTSASIANNGSVMCLDFNEVLS